MPAMVRGAAHRSPHRAGGLRVPQAAWSRFGKLPWRRLVQPAASLADGFEVGPLLAADIAKYATQLQQFPYTRELYFPKGNMLKEGARATGPGRI